MNEENREEDEEKIINRSTLLTHFDVLKNKDERKSWHMDSHDGCDYGVVACLPLYSPRIQKTDTDFLPSSGESPLRVCFDR